mmetsp:Transcript_2884/g.5018  ORF Transcript_2884/g.5018 Transcript_2884/m.5018 type:complete len:92 (-) Transcript_2884:104-379(-)
MALPPAATWVSTCTTWLLAEGMPGVNEVSSDLCGGLGFAGIATVELSLDHGDQGGGGDGGDGGDKGGGIGDARAVAFVGLGLSLGGGTPMP